MKFTRSQIRDWRVYERTRTGGKWNMFDPRARLDTGLSEKRYSFVISNYTQLKEAANPPNP